MNGTFFSHYQTLTSVAYTEKNDKFPLYIKIMGL